MYEVAEYTDVNNQGTAVLLQALMKEPVERLIVASSMSLMGKGSTKRRRERISPAWSGHWGSSKPNSGTFGQTTARR